jgi:NADH-quinone oxidoreductase subunit L
MTLALMTAIPLATALLLVILGSRVARAWSAIAGAGALVIALGAATAIAQAFAAGKISLVAELGPWLPIRGASIAFVVDPRTVPLLLATTAIGAGIGIYAAVSLRRDRAAVRFFIALDLLVASLVIVLAARDLILLLAGWEGVGVSAYLLFVHERNGPESSAGAERAFVLGRAADAALVVAALALLALFQTVDLEQINSRLAASAPARPVEGLLAASALVVLAALMRAGQLPFHVSLPDRSQAHPASIAAIHGLATAAGAFLLLRLAAILDPSALSAAATVGIASAILAIVSAMGERRVACERWFTVAQFGIVIAACGLGSPSVGPLVIGTSLTRGGLALLADRWPRLARLLSTVGILAAAAVLGSGSPPAPFLAALAAVVLLAVMDASLEIGGDRIGVRAPLVRIGRAVAGAFGLLERSTTRAFRMVATVLERGGVQAIATTEDALVRVALRLGAWVDRLQRSSVWAHEALLLTAAAVIVLYWIVR